MSKQLTLLQIQPNVQDWENKPEVIQVIAECPMCKGKGTFTRATGYHGSAKDEVVVKDCLRCKGTGRLKADVIIRWTPCLD